MIARMAKPEEVIVVEDENGNIVRETMKDTDTLARYKTMHETLVYLSNLGHEDTENQMLEQLKMQVSVSKPWWRCTLALHPCGIAFMTVSTMTSEVHALWLSTPVRYTHFTNAAWDWHKISSCMASNTVTVHAR